MHRKSIVSILVFALAAPSAFAATRKVTNTDDSGSGSLRQAVLSAQGGDTIVFDLLTLPATITLTSGQLEVGVDLTIVGPGASQLKISGNLSSRVFLVVSGASLSIEGLRLTGGRADRGGAVFAGPSTQLSVRDAVMEFNLAFGDPSQGISARGGAIFINSGVTLLIERCIFQSNVVLAPDNTTGPGIPAQGGAMFIENPISITIRDSTFSNNLASGGGATVVGDGGEARGGAVHIISNLATLIERSTFSANRANGGSSVTGTGGMAVGGALYLGASGLDTLVRLSTFSNNLADGGQGAVPGEALGGAVYSDSPGALEFLTVRGNEADSGTSALGGGLALFSGSTLKQSIVAQNLAASVPEDIFAGGGAQSLGYNLVRTLPGGSFGTLGTDDVGNGTDPLLGPLLDHGGPTLTHALLPGSPALDAIPPEACAADVDQRLVVRPQGPACDIGAYEFSPFIFADGFETGGTTLWSLTTP